MNETFSDPQKNIDLLESNYLVSSTLQLLDDKAKLEEKCNFLRSDPPVWRIVNYASGLVLFTFAEVYGETVRLRAYTGDLRQVWRFRFSGDEDYFDLKNKAGRDGGFYPKIYHERDFDREGASVRASPISRLPDNRTKWQLALTSEDDLFGIMNVETKKLMGVDREDVFDENTVVRQRSFPEVGGSLQVPFGYIWHFVKHLP